MLSLCGLLLVPHLDNSVRVCLKTLQEVGLAAVAATVATRRVALDSSMLRFLQHRELEHVHWA